MGKDKKQNKEVFGSTQQNNSKIKRQTSQVVWFEVTIYYKIKNK